ncbi:Uncharacterised protein [Escherichia coli]|nr:Uncharacterised protein [Escherichia coli]
MPRGGSGGVPGAGGGQTNSRGWLHAQVDKKNRQQGQCLV